MKYSNRLSTVGNRIRKEREKIGLKKSDFLPRIYKSETSHKTLTAWENGERLPDTDSLALMAELFDCDMGYLLGDYAEHHRVTADICTETGLTEKAVDVILQYKNQNPEYIKSLNFLLESDNFESVLSSICEYSETLHLLKGLEMIKAKRIGSANSTREYKPDINLLDRISKELDNSDLKEYQLSTRLGHIVQEIRRKVYGNG